MKDVTTAGPEIGSEFRTDQSPRPAADIGRLVVRCEDRPGLISAVTGFLAGVGANIVSLDQFATEQSGGVFIQRVGTGSRCAALQSHRAAVKNDAMHKFTTRVARAYEVAVAEALPVEGMSKSAKGTVENPGKNVGRKSTLNRRIRDARWATMVDQLTYKFGSTEAAPTVFLVNPAYSSQRCPECGHIAAENRESQAEFRCANCGHTANADVNAGVNLVDKHRQGWTIPARSKGKTVVVSAIIAPALKRKPPALTGS